MRYKLLEWYSNPPLAEIQYGIDILKQKAESEFEIDVGERIIKKGYKVVPQFKPLPNDFNYRIDLVVQGDKRLIGIECDGELYHGPDRWEYDQRRESQLRRAGWKFWRISGSAFYRNKEKSLESLWTFLENEGINPKPLSEMQGDAIQVVLGEEEGQKSLTQSSPNEILTEKPNKTKDDDKHHKEPEQSRRENQKKTDHLQSGHVSVKLPDRIDQIKGLLELSENWKVWQNLVIWGERTGNVDSRSRAIGYQIIDKLKLGRKISPWLRQEMEKIWRIAIKKGFKAEINLS